MSIPDFSQSLFDYNGEVVCGVDEAGRGPLAGPVFAAAVIFDPAKIIEGLRDSKKLCNKVIKVCLPLIHLYFLT